MAWPEWTVTNKISEKTTTTTSAIVRVINAIISNVTNIFTYLRSKVQLDSVLLQNKVISGPTTIPHTLGRTLTGWQIVRQSGPAMIWDTQSSNTNPKTYLQLDSSAAVTVSLLVF